MDHVNCDFIGVYTCVCHVVDGVDLWCVDEAGILTDGLKRGLQFPRPSDVDIKVIEPGFQRPPLLVDGGAGNSFWALPSSEAMAATKRQTDWSYGLPSGHVAAAKAFF